MNWDELRVRAREGRVCSREGRTVKDEDYACRGEPGKNLG